MPEKILVGPLLGFEGNDTYTICFLTTKNVKDAQVQVDGKNVTATLVKEIPDGSFWRAVVEISAPSDDKGGRWIHYGIYLDKKMSEDEHGRSNWIFYIPSINEPPRFAYASCNGVSKTDLITKIKEPFALWRKMANIHRTEPFSLLIMGGDQVYADSIWEKVKTLEDWSTLDFEDQLRRTPSKKMSRQLDQFYSKLYRQRWSDKDMSYMLASVPSVMMWDDHDIFDGWGSFPRDLQRSPVFSEIFKYAKKYFEIFQIRGPDNQSLLDTERYHYAFSFKYRNYTILGLDNRSERSIRQVMSPSQWDKVIECLETAEEGTLLVMSAVPVVYRDFSFTETAMDVTPWDESLADDIKDHWRAKEHQGERNRLIMRLLDNAKKRHSNMFAKTVILSGDVHVGCLGVVTDSRHEQPVKVHQVVSSGVIHPAPSLMQWLGITAVTNDEIEIINEERTIEASMLKPVGAKRYIRARNFVTLEEGTDQKLWVNWVTDEDEASETAERPVYPIASSPTT